MDISTFSNVTPKIVLQQACWFILKTFSKCTYDCAGVKKIVNQECVDNCLNTPTLLCCALIDAFCDNGGYFLKGQIHFALQVQFQLHL
ncbi:hypothetical protein AB205_0199750 [Aquarana catesbeiana]|uniref:Uncharacterized protein n=1 Tax=Aquarana catesbeiana TaxID=8400 RepID=A0A2G9SAQ0_AQUCT|nr:hypothetical protein AB205_0199750 [Aquarana catesbeiana]